MDYQNILTKQNDGVLLITINRPRNLNALNHSTILELNHAFLNAEKQEYKMFNFDRNRKAIFYCRC